MHLKCEAEGALESAFTASPVFEGSLLYKDKGMITQTLKGFF